MVTDMYARRSSWGKLAGVMVTAAVLAVGLAGCSGGSDTGSGSTDTLTLATQPWLGYGPWYIAQEKGFFEDQGLDVKITSFDEDAEMTASLGSGQVDVANAASHTVLQWVESHQDGYIALLLDTSETADAILANSSISSIADLKGKRIAYEEGSVSNLLLDHALSENGLSISDISPVPMGPSDAAVALSSGRVDAAVTYEPYITDALGENSGIKTLYTASEKEGLIGDVLFVSKKAAEEKPEAVKKAVLAWGDAIDFYKSNKSEAQEIIAENIGSKAEDLETAFDGVKFFSLEDNKKQLGDDYLNSVLPSVEESAIHAGIVEQKLDLKSIVSTDFLPE